MIPTVPFDGLKHDASSGPPLLKPSSNCWDWLGETKLLLILELINAEGDDQYVDSQK
jgi:hypothetical protein